MQHGGPTRAGQLPANLRRSYHQRVRRIGRRAGRRGMDEAVLHSFGSAVLRLHWPTLGTLPWPRCFASPTVVASRLLSRVRPVLQLDIQCTEQGLLLRHLRDVYTSVFCAYKAAVAAQRVAIADAQASRERIENDLETFRPRPAFPP